MTLDLVRPTLFRQILAHDLELQVIAQLHCDTILRCNQLPKAWKEEREMRNRDRSTGICHKRMVTWRRQEAQLDAGITLKIVKLTQAPSQVYAVALPVNNGEQFDAANELLRVETEAVEVGFEERTDMVGCGEAERGKSVLHTR
jgi:hypothetical protein